MWNEETVILNFADFAEKLQDNTTLWFYKGKNKAGRTVHAHVLNQGDRIVRIVENVEWEPGIIKQEEFEPFFKKRLTQMGFDGENAKIDITVMASGTQVRTNWASVHCNFGYAGNVKYVDGGPHLTSFGEQHTGYGTPYPAPAVINEYFIANWV